MKLLFCGECMDIRAPDPKGEWTSCRCGNAAVRWLDPARGILRVRANHTCHVRIIGMHNAMLWASLGGNGNPNVPPMPRPKSNVEWRKLHDDLVKHAEGYIFHESKRASWAAVMEVGTTGDVQWEDATPVTISETAHGSDTR